jgi:hypothetical protein
MSVPVDEDVGDPEGAGGWASGRVSAARPRRVLAETGREDGAGRATPDQQDVGGRRKAGHDRASSQLENPGMNGTPRSKRIDLRPGPRSVFGTFVSRLFSLVGNAPGMSTALRCEALGRCSMKNLPARA